MLINVEFVTVGVGLFHYVFIDFKNMNYFTKKCVYCIENLS